MHLAAHKHWFDWLVSGHVLEVNPPKPSWGPRDSQNTGKTPILDRAGSTRAGRVKLA